MSSREIVLWLDERWYDALERHIKGETLQDKMESYLDELCNNLLPDYEYEQISKEIYEERIAQAEQREANRCFAVFHVTEFGEQSYFLVDEPIEFVNAARSMRTYVRSDDPAAGFRNYFAAAQEITPEEFRQYVTERMENTGRVVGAFDVDLDRGEFSALNVSDGWHTYSVRDVSNASYHADRKSLLPTAERTARLLDYLDGRELSPEQTQPPPTMTMGQTMG